MVSWQDLPPEIHEIILQQFCNIIASDFETLPQITTSEFRVRYGSFGTDNLEWPKQAPKCLCSFVSALRTCRYFWYIINNGVKVKGVSPVTALQQIQLLNIYQFNSAKDERLFEGNLVDEATDLVYLYLISGCFWRNPLIIEFDMVIEGVFLSLCDRGKLMLIPHLESWLLHFSEPLSPFPQEMGQRTWELELQDPDGELDNVFIHLVNGNKVLYGDIFVLESIEGVAEGNLNEDIPDVVLPLFHDIQKSPPNTWWYFPMAAEMSTDYHELESCFTWFLVNYELRKMYIGPQWGQVYSWENPWEVKYGPELATSV